MEIEEEIRVVIVPPNPREPYRRSFRPGIGPNPFLAYEHLERQGIKTRFLDPTGRPWNPFAGRNPLLQSIDPVRTAKIILQQKHIDIVVSVTEGGAALLSLLKSALMPRVRVVIWDLMPVEDWQLSNRLLDITIPRVDGIMVLGSNQGEYIRQRWNPSGKIVVIGHGVDTDFFQPRPIEPDGFILSVGEDAGRDFATLMRAAEGIQREVVIKSTRSAPLPHQSASRVRVVSKWMSYIELRELYTQSALVVVPMRQTLNASGVSTILEASAMGRPLIVSDNIAIRDFIVPNETCLMVPRDDPAALQAAIERLLQEPETCARLAAGARKFVETHCSPVVFAQRLGSALKIFAT